MAEIVNLRMARKAKARAIKEAAAEESRVRHGLSRAERLAADRVRQQETRHIEGHRRLPAAGAPDEAPEE
ncbi:DUF4169 family protein [Afifella sp. IM 167]|uniref:DUF4169 family protein n=1 Tax=Afifella sp. IM 167 TaxID=2033586 RepID=UPI001CCA2FC9|nr:DUF4169 family protein [Afifella sp. IM 167]MBZ8135222.1 DUF4169 domain-containing protein [Afifella sp. IM 167]